MKSLIPKMNSDTQDGFEILTSSIFSNDYKGYKAFNKQPCSSNGNSWACADNVKKGWIQINLPKCAFVNRYSIQSRNLYDAPTTAPREWIFEGSNDGFNWQVLDNKIEQSFTQAENKIFNIKGGYFKCFRINISKNNGSRYLVIDEIELFGNYAIDIPIKNNIYKNIYINKNYKIPYKISNIQDKKEQLQNSNTLEMSEGKMFNISISELKRYSEFKIKSLALD
ncbi:discoidin domain-containing protein [Clostridium sp. Marseille-QA1073]